MRSVKSSCKVVLEGKFHNVLDHLKSIYLFASYLSVFVFSLSICFVTFMSSRFVISLYNWIVSSVSSRFVSFLFSRFNTSLFTSRFVSFLSTLLKRNGKTQIKGNIYYCKKIIKYSYWYADVDTTITYYKKSNNPRKVIWSKIEI